MGLWRARTATERVLAVEVTAGDLDTLLITSELKVQLFGGGLAWYGGHLLVRGGCSPTLDEESGVAGRSRPVALDRVGAMGEDLISRPDT